MCCNKLLLPVFLPLVLLASEASNARGQGPDPAVVNLEFNTVWRYRDPYAKREFSITLTNAGDAPFESPRGNQYVCVYVREATPLSGYVREYPVLHLPFERLAPGEEVTLRGQYFQDIERGASPAKMRYRAEIVYRAALAIDQESRNDDVNLANNKAWPAEPVQVTLLPRRR